MDDERFAELVRTARDVMRPWLERSESGRRLATLLAEWVLDECRAIEAARDAPPTEPAAPLAEPAVAAPEPPASPSAGEVLAQAVQTARTRQSGRWTIGTRLSAGEADGPPARSAQPVEAPPPPADIDLTLIARRCALKARSCRLFIERRDAMGDPAREAPLIRQVDTRIAEARELSGCFLWMLYRDREQPDDEALRRIADCYDALGEAASLVSRVDDLGTHARPDDLRQAMYDLARAHSALRAALAGTWLTMPDVDQQDAHDWLRENTGPRGVFIARHMRLDDPADPAASPELIGAIAERRREIEVRAEKLARVHAVFKQLRYHARRLERDGDRPDSHDRDRVLAAVTAALDLGVPVSDRRFGDALPGVVAARLAQVAVSGIHRDLFEQIARPDPGGIAPIEAASREWSGRVLQVRDLLQDQQVVVIGGEPRTSAARRLEEAFALSNLEWVRLSEHGSSEPMRAPIAAADTALVLVIVKLAGHQQAEDASTLASRLGKPCVFLRAGYNPESVADAILQQASQQLSRGRVLPADS